MRNRSKVPTFTMEFGFDSYDSRMPGIIVERLKCFFPHPIRVHYREKPYPAIILLRGVRIELVSGVYTAVIAVLDGRVNVSKGVFIKQERGGIITKISS